MIVGFTASCFDLLHSGHILMLREAKNNCDYLICGLQTDPTVDRPNKNKPIQTLMERHIQLSAVKYVDEIIPYTTESELEDLLTHLPIDIRFLGEEYSSKEFTGKNIRHKLGFHYNKRRHKLSTSELRERIINGNINK